MDTQPLTFDEILDTIERLPIEQQETLLDVLHNRLIELRREQIARNAAEARQLYHAGKLPTGTVDDLMVDLSSDEGEE
jgi:ribosomal protein S4